MAVIAQVKKDMEFYKGLSSLLKVLKGIAVTQFHILERKIHTFDKFSDSVQNFLGGIEIGDVAHPFLNPTVDHQAVIAVTSDSGLLGGLNMQVMTLAFEQLKSKHDMLLVLGERGKIYAREQHFSYVGFPGIKEEERIDLALTLRDYVLERVVDGKIGFVNIIYPRALSLIVQRIEHLSILPYGVSAQEQEVRLLNLNEFIMESSLDNIVEYLIYLWFGQRLFEIFGEARLAELAARFIHLEESSQRLEELEKKLKLKYFRLRHELTDRSMRELFAARSLYGTK